MRHTLRLFLATAFMALAMASASAQTAGLEKKFRNWLENELWPTAAKQGISRQTFDASLSGVRLNLDLPDLVIPGAAPKVPKKQHQAEFSQHQIDEDRYAVLLTAKAR